MKIRTVVTFLLLASLLPAAWAQTEDTAIEDVVVTAQKRQQNLLDIGIDISVISGEDAREDARRRDRRHRAPRLQHEREEDARRNQPRRDDPRCRPERFQCEQQSHRRRVRGRGVPHLHRDDGLSAVRHGAGRGPERPAGHALRPQHHRRRRELRDPQAQPAIRSLRQRRLRGLPLAGNGGGDGRPAQRCTVVSCCGEISGPGEGIFQGPGQRR